MITGFMMGMVIGNLIMVLWHQTWWKEMSAKPALSGWGHLGIQILANAISGIIVWLRIPFLFYPVSILSTGTVFLLLGMIYCLIWIIIFKKENSFEHYKDGLSFVLAGLATAVVQIGLLDLLRYSLTGTWQGLTSILLK
jgi:membrane-associated HD superfamily phosphohydrolase